MLVTYTVFSVGSMHNERPTNKIQCRIKVRVLVTYTEFNVGWMHNGWFCKCKAGEGLGRMGLTGCVCSSMLHTIVELLKWIGSY